MRPDGHWCPIEATAKGNILWYMGKEITLE